MTLYKGDLSITPLGSITAIIGLYRTIIAIIVKMVFPDDCRETEVVPLSDTSKEGMVLPR